MKVEIKMPQMGESVAEGTIIKWWKQPGDAVEKEETLFEISTDKVDTEVPSPAGGILVEVLYPEGETIEINTVIAYIETEADKAVVKEAPQPSAEKAAEPGATPEKEEPAPPPAAESASEKREAFSVAESVAPGKPDSDGSRRGFFSPVVLRIAREEGISLDALNAIEGSGIGGRITKKDILRNLDRLKGAPAPLEPAKEAPAGAPAAAPVPKPPPRREIDFTRDDVSVVPMSNMRQKIAEHMVRSVKTSPHVTSVTEVDMTDIVKHRAKANPEFEEREGFKLTYTAYIVRAVTMAIRDFPEINASIDENNIVYRKHVNMGVAVALENGLIVPVIRNAEEKNLTGIARAVYDLGTRARTKKLLPEEVQGATISLTNPGIFGTLYGTPIINQPNVAIIGVGAIKKRPVVINDAIAIRHMMYLTLTYDHRLIDGALSAQFLQKTVEYLENMETLI